VSTSAVEPHRLAPISIDAAIARCNVRHSAVSMRRERVGQVPARGEFSTTMALDPIPAPMTTRSSGEAVRARWARLANDFARLPCVAVPDSQLLVRDVGELLLRGLHDEALAEAERYVSYQHTIRTGHVVECDDIDDLESLARWVRELDRASAEGHAPPVPEGFWASFLSWRTPLGMARLTDRRHRSSRRVRIVT
jgi:hypothetical protein